MIISNQIFLVEQHLVKETAFGPAFRCSPAKGAGAATSIRSRYSDLCKQRQQKKKKIDRFGKARKFYETKKGTSIFIEAPFRLSILVGYLQAL